MNTAENLKKIALIFFAVLGTTHILSGLMMANSYLLPVSLIINKVFDIPFAMSAVIYGFSTLYAKTAPQKQHLMSIIYISASIGILLVLLYINLLIPDRTVLIS